LPVPLGYHHLRAEVPEVCVLEGLTEGCHLVGVDVLGEDTPVFPGTLSAAGGIRW